jgi:excisionase family DNA binding protein
LLANFVRHFCHGKFEAVDFWSESECSQWALAANSPVFQPLIYDKWMAYGLLPTVDLRSDEAMKRPDTSIRLLTLAEAASILKISKRTLHRMIQNRQIPAFKVGGQWRILESRFQEWVQEEENTTPKAS